MPQSLSLAAYMALVRRNQGQAPVIDHPRPQGPLIWAHADSAARILALLQLAARLTPLRRGLHLLLTAPPDVAVPKPMVFNVIWQTVPDETLPAVRGFIDHWSPDIGLWSGGFLRPALILTASERKIPLFLVDASETGFDEVRWRWLPNMARKVLGHFRGVYATSANAATRLRRLGVAAEDITITGPLQAGSVVLPYNAGDRAELARALTGRPVWVAAQVQLDELQTVLQAHRIASRPAHRLVMLIVVPANLDEVSQFTEAVAAEGWRSATWSEGQFPDESTQILLADTAGELGLWYRIAPVSFLASSLREGTGGCDPYGPAALGSALIYGPYVGQHLQSFGRFANAGAARMVRDAETLASAVSRMIAPDQSAAMALAGWQVASEGAEVTDKLIELVQETLDLAGAD